MIIELDLCWIRDDRVRFEFRPMTAACTLELDCSKQRLVLEVLRNLAAARTQTKPAAPRTRIRLPGIVELVQYSSTSTHSAGTVLLGFFWHGFAGVHTLRTHSC